MKKLVFIFSLTLLCVSLNAQINHPNYHDGYDTLIIFQPPQIQGCPMFFDTTIHATFYDTSFHANGYDSQGNLTFDTILTPLLVAPEYDYSLDKYYYKKKFCEGDFVHDTILLSSSGPLIGSNSYHVNQFAQPYHLDSSMLICGIATQMAGDVHSYDYENQKFNQHYFHLLDSNFTTITKSVYMTALVLDSNGDTIMPYNNPYKLRSFYFDSVVNIRNFYLSADVEPITTDFADFAIGYCNPHFNYSLSLYDTSDCLKHICDSLRMPYDSIFVGLFNGYQSHVTDTVICCQSDISPWLFRNNTWTSFADDSLYYIFQKTYIQFLPIILVPHNSNTSSLSPVELNNITFVYPNPANDELNALCNYKIKNIEIYNIQGKLLKLLDINNFSTKLDVHSLIKGEYIIKLNTVKGCISKKFIKN